MLEKKYFEVYKDGRFLGAFENVTDFEEQEDKITFTSDEGRFTYVLEDGIWSSEDNDIEFDDYNLLGRRALLRHADAHGIEVPNDRRKAVTTYNKFQRSEDKDEAKKFIISRLEKLNNNKPTSIEELVKDTSWVNNQLTGYFLAKEKGISDQVKDYLDIEFIPASELKAGDVFGIISKESKIILKSRINKCIDIAILSNLTFIETEFPNSIYDVHRINKDTNSTNILYFRNDEEVIRIKLN